MRGMEMTRPFRIINRQSGAILLIVKIEQYVSVTFLVTDQGRAINHRLFMQMYRRGIVEVEA